MDILTVGNLYVSEIETTRNDAGTGLILYGDGKNNFKATDHFETGFFANKDAKKVKISDDGSKKLIFVANNDDWVQIFEMNEE